MIFVAVVFGSIVGGWWWLVWLLVCVYDSGFGWVGCVWWLRFGFCGFGLLWLFTYGLFMLFVVVLIWVDVCGCAVWVCCSLVLLLRGEFVGVVWLNAFVVCLIVLIL